MALKDIVTKAINIFVPRDPMSYIVCPHSGKPVKGIVGNVGNPYLSKSRQSKFSKVDTTNSSENKKHTQ